MQKTEYGSGRSTLLVFLTFMFLPSRLGLHDENRRLCWMRLFSFLPASTGSRLFLPMTFGLLPLYLRTCMFLPPPVPFFLIPSLLPFTLLLSSPFEQ
jgi:hypothetical protein